MIAPHEFAAAIAEHNFYEVEQLLNRHLRNNTPVNSINYFGGYYQGDETRLGTLLNWAIHYKQTRIAQILLEHGADTTMPAAILYELNTSLHFAVLNNQEEIASLILNDPQTKIDALNRNQQTALHLACDKNDHHIVQLILDCVKNRGLDIDAYVNAVDVRKKTSLHYAAPYPDAVIVNILLKYNVLLWQIDDSEETPLHCAMHYNAIEVVRCLIEHSTHGVKAGVNAKNLWGNTALHIIGEDLPPDDALRVTQVLIKAGIDIHAKNTARMTPLQWVARIGQLRVVELLLDLEVDASHQDRNNKTALHYVLSIELRDLTKQYPHLKNDQFSIIKLLLNAGAGINQQDEFGNSALHYAAAYWPTAITQLLLSNGANIYLLDNDTNSVLHKAAHAKNIELMHVLAQKGCDPLIPNVYGSLAVKSLSISDQETVQEDLLKNYCEYERTHRGLAKTFPLKSIELLVRAKHDPILTPWLTKPLLFLLFCPQSLYPVSKTFSVRQLKNKVFEYFETKEEMLSKATIKHIFQLPYELRIKIWSAFLFSTYISKTTNYKSILQDHVESLLGHINRLAEKTQTHDFSLQS